MQAGLLMDERIARAGRASVCPKRPGLRMRVVMLPCGWGSLALQPDLRGEKQRVGYFYMVLMLTFVVLILIAPKSVILFIIIVDITFVLIFVSNFSFSLLISLHVLSPSLEAVSLWVCRCFWWLCKSFVMWEICSSQRKNIALWDDVKIIIKEIWSKVGSVGRTIIFLGTTGDIQKWYPWTIG